MAVFRMIALASALWLAAAPAKALDLAGTVAALRGSAFATGPNGFERRLQVGSTILVGDRIATSPDGRLRLAMNDGAALGLGEASTITIAVYDVDESAGNAVLGFEGGVLLAESGAIARLGPGRFSIDTPVAFLGILGGRVVGRSLPGQTGADAAFRGCRDGRDAAGQRRPHAAGDGTRCRARRAAAAARAVGCPALGGRTRGGRGGVAAAAGRHRRRRPARVGRRLTPRGARRPAFRRRACAPASGRRRSAPGSGRRAHRPSGAR